MASGFAVAEDEARFSGRYSGPNPLGRGLASFMRFRGGLRKLPVSE
jgi:hypothetical protein